MGRGDGEGAETVDVQVMEREGGGWPRGLGLGGVGTR